MAAAVASLAMTARHGFMGSESHALTSRFEDDSEDEAHRDAPPQDEYPMWPNGDIRLTWAEGCCPHFGQSNWAFQRQNRVVRSSNGSVALRKVCLGAIECTGEGCTVAIKPGLRKTTLLKRLLTRCRLCGGRMVYKSCDAAVVYETFPPGACDGYPGGKLVMRHYGQHKHSRPIAKDHRLIDPEADPDSDARSTETNSPTDDARKRLSLSQSPTNADAVRATPSPRDTVQPKVEHDSPAAPAHPQPTTAGDHADTKGVDRQLWAPIQLLASACEYVAVARTDADTAPSASPTVSQQAGEIIAQLRMAGTNRRHATDSESSETSIAAHTANMDTPKRGRGRPRAHTQPQQMPLHTGSPSSATVGVHTPVTSGSSTPSDKSRKRSRPNDGRGTPPPPRTRCKTSPSPVSALTATHRNGAPLAQVPWPPNASSAIASAGVIFSNGACPGAHVPVPVYGRVAIAYVPQPAAGAPAYPNRT